jgi:hypothetical protein
MSTTQVNLLNDDVDVNSLTAASTVTGTFIGDGSSISNLVIGANVVEAKAYLFSDSTVHDVTTFIQKNVFPVTGSLDINEGAFTSTSSGIVVPSDGQYICGVTAYCTSTVQRASVQVAFTVNGTVQAEIGSSGYIRSSSGHNQATTHLTTIYTMVAGDELGLAFRRDSTAAAGTAILQPQSIVFLYKV